MSKTKKILTILGILILSAGIIAGVSLVGKKQQIQEKAASASTASINPASQNVSAGQSFSLTVNLDTGSNRVMAVDITANFDPKIIQINSMAKGSGIDGFTNEVSSLNAVDNVKGQLHYVNFTLDTYAAASGSNVEILKIAGSVKAGATGSAKINFGKTTSASAIGENNNVLTTLNGATIVIVRATSTPIPTFIATPTAQAFPTFTSQATPKTYPTASPTETAASLPAAASPFPVILVIVLGIVVIIVLIVVVKLFKRTREQAK